MPKKSEPPKRLRKEHRRCTQVQCSFYLEGHCKKCSECGARPYEINTTCKRCLDCENVPNSLRWDQPKDGKEAAKNNAEKVFLEMIKKAAEERLADINTGKPSAEKDEEEQTEICVSIGIDR